MSYLIQCTYNYHILSAILYTSGMKIIGVTRQIVRILLYYFHIILTIYDYDIIIICFY